MKSNDIRFVLVEPSHPGNIGAVARAMKNMGLEDLVLVKPKSFPHSEATARASGADDVLAKARVVQSVAEAIEGCGFVVATTSRGRDLNYRVLEVRDAAQRVVEEARRGTAAVLFGAERMGLTNEEIDVAHVLIRIPGNPQYLSLNVAMAAQIVAYEIFQAGSAGTAIERPESGTARESAVPFATPEQMARLYAHLAQVMEEVEFRDRTQSGTNLMERIHRFLQRAELDQNEANILRGFLTCVQKKCRKAGSVDGVESSKPIDLPAPARQVFEGSTPPAIYLDYAATTPVDPAVARAMSACLDPTGAFGNASSTTHAFGRAAAQIIENARAQVAALIGASPEEIIFTSGATESSNLAILGAARAGAYRGKHVVSARTEHKAVLDPCKRLEKEGFTVSYLVPDRMGVISAQTLRAALRDDTVLVSLMHVNNEIGVIQEIAALAAVCRERGIAFHCDAAQSVGKLPVDVNALGVDFLSFTAHKIYGPKGVGALYVRRASRPRIQAVSFGGGQEQGLRPGTLPTHQIVGLGEACALAAECAASEQPALAQLQDRLWKGLAELEGVHLNGELAPRVAQILSVSFEGVEGESLVMGLSELAVSTGSACSSASGEPSYVLRALGRNAQLAQSSLRFSLGRSTTAQDIEIAVSAVKREVLRLRALSPASAAEPFAAELGRPGADQTEMRVEGEAGSVAQEAWIRFHLLVDGDAVKAARFQAYGCPHTLAVTAWLTGRLPGRSRGDLVPGTPQQWAQALEVPVEKLGRLLRVEDALRDCLQHWSTRP